MPALVSAGLGEPLITVVVPTRNRAALLAVALESVFASPLITAPQQIIVADDDSEDETEAVARRFGTRYLRVAHHGPSGPRNAGLAHAETPYVTFLDDDDAWLAGNMEAQLAALEANPEAAFAYGVARSATANLEPLRWTYPSPPLASGLAPEQLYLGVPQLGAVLFRREALAEVGGFDQGVSYGEDADLMVRIAARHSIIGIDVIGVLRRERAPSRARADYHWGARRLAWKPPAGVGWRAIVTFGYRRRRRLFYAFCEDATGCLAGGQRRDALLCLSRALRMSPLHALRHPQRVGSTLWRSLFSRTDIPLSD